MSGIVGILNLDGAPVDRQLLTRMTDAMAFRGPDAQTTWSRENVGFGHALLRTTDESADEQQPFSFDNTVWITADARIDAREELIRKLAAKGRVASLQRPDAELILHAYLAWGEDCVDHLLGDFAFAIWDERKRSLFCARDHFGIKPFFYAQVGSHLIFSNTLNCVRLHPAVSDELNEVFIGDFLLFDSSQDFDATAFADIHRLPPAHTLHASEAGLRLRKYWAMPEGDLVQYRRKQDYIDQFLELFRAAVGDRLRTNGVSVQMSGGLDSTAVAAIAKELLAKRSSSFELEAHTVVYDHLIPDQERYYAGLAADWLKIPIHYFVADEYRPFDGFGSPKLRPPEPVHNPFLKLFLDFTKNSGMRHRIVLTGSDGDTFFFELPNLYFNDLFNRRKFAKLLLELGRFTWAFGELPRIGFRAWMRKGFTRELEDRYPQWLKSEFTRRCNLRERWAAYSKQTPGHPTRQRIYRVLNSTLWSQSFEQCDAGETMQPIEYRHPLADIRILQFALSLPQVPWLVNKELVRFATRGILPDGICLRPKTPLAGDPFYASVQRDRRIWVNQPRLLALIERFVERSALSTDAMEASSLQLWGSTRPLSLNFWLADASPANH